MTRRQYGPIPVNMEIDRRFGTGRASTLPSFFERRATFEQTKRDKERLGKPAAMPLEVWNKRNTHLLGWLFDAKHHLRRGSALWCQTYLDSAREYFFAMHRDRGVPIPPEQRKMFEDARHMWNYAHWLYVPPDFADVDFQVLAHHIAECEKSYELPTIEVV